MTTKTNKRQFTGIITSIGMKNTVVVKVDQVKIHPRYHKRYTVSKKYHCDWRGDSLKIGQKVFFEETRPLSKTKRWRIIANPAQ